MQRAALLNIIDTNIHNSWALFKFNNSSEYKFNKWHNYIFYALQLTIFLSLEWKLITYQILKHKPPSMRTSTDDVVRAFHVALEISLWILLRYFLWKN